MTRFASYDGTQIGYRTLGDGPPLVCLPGGPGRTCEYFGDLGGLSRSRQLIMPDRRCGRALVPERDGDRSARGRALPMARRPGLLHRRDHLIPELGGVVIDVPATG